MALILKTIINSGTGSVYNYLSERKKGWNQILFYDRNKLKPSRKFLFNTVDSKFSYCAYFKCHVTADDSFWSLTRWAMHAVSMLIHLRLFKWWQWCWWHRYVGDFMMVTDLRCRWQNHYVGDFFRYVGDFPNILNWSPTSWIGHQHIKLVTKTFGLQHRCHRLNWTKIKVVNSLKVVQNFWTKVEIRKIWINGLIYFGERSGWTKIETFDSKRHAYASIWYASRDYLNKNEN